MTVLLPSGLTQDEWNCRRKRTYKNKKSAKRAARHTETNSDRPGKIHTYKCDLCGYFHNGHRPRPNPKGTP